MSADELDFDAVEQLMEGKGPALEEDRAASRTRDRSEDVDRKGPREGDGERQRDRDRDRDRGGSRVRDRDRDRSRGREAERDREERKAREREEKRKREEERRQKDEEERKKKEEADARRDDLTVLVLNIALKSEEKDIYKFFSKGAGKVRDIQLIRDARSGKSKGVAYVEFYTQEGLLKALALSGQMFQGQPVKVQASQAEKNRAAKQAKEQELAARRMDGPCRLYVGNLVDLLANISDKDLEQVFKPFGTVEQVEVCRDGSGKCKGYAFVQMAKANEAKDALMALNGYLLLNQPLKVGLATDPRGQQQPPLTEMQQKVAEAIQMGMDPVEANKVLMEQLNSMSSGPPPPPPPPMAVPGLSQIPGSTDAAAIAAAAQQAAQAAAALTGGGLASLAGLGGLGAGLGALPTLPLAGASVLPTGFPSAPAASPDASALLGAGAALGMGGLGVGAGLGAGAGAGASSGGAGDYRTQIPSANISLANVYDPSPQEMAKALAEEPTFWEDLMEDIKGEAEKQGPVLKVWVNKMTPDGSVYLKFAAAPHATAAAASLSGRWFGGKQISVSYIPEDVFNLLTSMG
uniref:RRM domain-containing protein n=1 Tax=Chromera velia CCMP2878 TaxID=1169474 RepID=A0A0G4FVS6_9ALVE|eukprot:Cvel_19014.t1-p1 / transcript=Cvel_19014.t1 / gene=Cvel_19014 / organism=Chromera_velia_CCMP2878 / gene_product=RNA-binding protein 39, putative / transcript_product=RNA-binding protein 39, putative / location=Cvel_scaffold1609:28888-35613(+) / protein_length=576 / sequence_SO=supercontig / SO=protein_coding / is_pseudo=false